MFFHLDHFELILLMQQTLSNIYCSIALLRQVFDWTLNRYRILQTNPVLSYSRKPPDLGLFYPKLDKEALIISSYSIASFVTNHDKRSQLEY